jgi:hypothetical protein
LIRFFLSSHAKTICIYEIVAHRPEICGNLERPNSENSDAHPGAML